MLLHRLTTAALAGVLLLLAACAPGAPTATVPPTAAASPLPAESKATAAPESTLPALDSPVATPVPAQPVVPTPSAGKAAVAGRVIDLKTGQPMANQTLSLPAVVCPPEATEENKREACVYVIDSAFDPSAIADDQGRFVFKDIAPGEYVMLIGNPTGTYVVLSDDFNQPLIWKTEADKVLQLGDLVIELR